LPILGNGFIQPDDKEEKMTTIVSTRRSKLGLKAPGRAAALAAVTAASLATGASTEAAALRVDRPALDSHADAPFETGPDSGPPMATRPVVPVTPAAAHPPALRPPDEVPAAQAQVEAVATPLAISSEDLRERVAQAERHYRENRFDDALRVFREVVELDPGHAHAWLRVGNVLHRNREWFDALTAYRRAARPQADPVIREKAVYNIALLNLELARQAIRRLERMRTDEPGATAGQERSGVTDASLRGLTDQLSSSYRTLSGARTRPEEPRAVLPAAATAPGISSSTSEVEVRQGGLAR
jgi:tetratricopeptide (TPR) repeat protein